MISPWIGGGPGSVGDVGGYEEGEKAYPESLLMGPAGDGGMWMDMGSVLVYDLLRGVGEDRVV